MNTSTNLFPPDNTFRSVSYASRFYGRSIRTIQEWCENGTFAVAGIPIFKDRKGHWWIRISADTSLTVSL